MTNNNVWHRRRHPHPKISSILETFSQVLQYHDYHHCVSLRYGSECPHTPISVFINCLALSDIADTKITSGTVMAFLHVFKHVYNAILKSKGLSKNHNI